LYSFFKKINKSAMEKITAQTHTSIQQLLGGFSEMPLTDIEYLIRELNALAARKRVVDSEKRSKFLLQKINESVLPEPVMERYCFLQEKMELENLSESEYQELLNLVAQEEKLRNKRFQYLLELSQVQGLSLVELMNQLGLNAQNYA
jgi:hypothetical protein